MNSVSLQVVTRECVVKEGVIEKATQFSFAIRG